MTYQIVYSSQANEPMSLHDLEEILEDARAGNTKRNITGALVYVDGVFLQVLEGERQAVQKLMKSIAADGRHFAVTVFQEGEVEQPLFSNWRMAYVSADPAQMAAWAGHEGTAPIGAILQSMRSDPRRTAGVIRAIFEALAA